MNCCRPYKAVAPFSRPCWRNVWNVTLLPSVAIFHARTRLQSLWPSFLRYGVKLNLWPTSIRSLMVLSWFRCKDFWSYCYSSIFRNDSPWIHCSVMQCIFNPPVSLFSQEEELDEQKVQTCPPGFHLIFLPFADDFRKLKLGDDVPRGKLFEIFRQNKE